MSIQQNINQLLAMAGTATMLSPQLRQKAQDRAALATLSKEEEALQTQTEATGADIIKNQQKVGELAKKLKAAQAGETTLSPQEQKELEDKYIETFSQAEALGSTIKDIEKQGIDIAERRFKIQPTAEGAKEIVDWKSAAYREQAKQRLRELGNRKLEQKSEFDEFRKSLDQDDPFHQLSPEAQKIAYEQYKKGGK